ncbi:TonB-dependent siderophore receptor [Alysiella crassa]|uniref:Ferric hydroxamate uptake n=1 Tax=Alysiella crassa TaxID=153491 RepID=A0A376BVJ0_9NEIS|nr:TonB-dependent siderophore receptor [Alysiella crassa]UOP06435.1 TonB-dependent siderophore receptor [Alysiella crassa]SSY80960.1 Ferric hydroxamate uptake [Alysiella crassa]
MQQQKFTHTLVATALLALFGQAAANDVATQELDTVTVRAGSMNRLGVVPFKQAKSTVAIKAADLRTEGVEKADELGRYQAGFSNQVFGSDTNTEWFRIRGTEATQAVDGKPTFSYGFFTPRTELYGVETVEVTKGADSLTFGAAKAGGLINYISKRAHKNQVGKGEVKVNIGNHKQAGIGADYTGSLNADNSLRYRVVGNYRTSDGEWDGTNNRTLYIAPSLQWDITPATQFNLLTSYQQDKGVPSSNFLPQEGSLVAFPDGSKLSPKANLGDPVNDTETNKQYSVGYEFTHKFSPNLTLDSSYRFNHVDNYHRGSYAYPSAYDAAWNPIPASQAGYILSRGVVFNDGTAKTHSFDNRLTWKLKNNWLDNTLVGGIDYRKQKADALYTLFGTTSSVNLQNIAAAHGQTQNVSAATKVNIDAQQLGFYLQNQARINKNFVVGLGVRHDRTKNEEHTSTQKVKTNHTSYSGSLMYQMPFGLNPYISYNESFHVPTGLSGTQKLYDPNITKQTEIGVKYLPTQFDGQLSVAAFRAKDKGALMSNGVGATVSNSDDVVRKGAEIQGSLNINDNIKAGLAYTYLNSVTQTTTGDVRNPLLPKHTAALRGSYSFHSGSLNGLTVGGGVRYVGQSVGAKNFAVYPSIKVPSATVFDLMASYDFAQNWSAQVNVDNVSNRRYVAGCDTYCYYGQGRNINASISYRFK